jgi:hypothetical protein
MPQALVSPRGGMAPGMHHACPGVCGVWNRTRVLSADGWGSRVGCTCHRCRRDKGKDAVQPQSARVPARSPASQRTLRSGGGRVRTPWIVIVRAGPAAVVRQACCRQRCYAPPAH